MNITPESERKMDRSRIHSTLKYVADRAAEVECPAAEPADILRHRAARVAWDLDVLAHATVDGIPEEIAMAAEDAAYKIDALIGTLMQAEGLTIEQAQSRAAILIAEEGEAW